MRIAAGVITLLSFLLCVAVLFLWFRSYRTADYVAYCQERDEHGVISTVGNILIYNETAIEPVRWKAPFGWQWAALPNPGEVETYELHNGRRARWMGFGFMSGKSSSGRYQASARFVPHWAVVLVLAILPLLWLRGTFRKRSARGFELVNQPELAQQNKTPTA